MPTRADLAKIHIAKKELALTDDAYRDMLRVHFNVESAKDLKPRQVTVLLNKFRAKGWKPRRSSASMRSRHRSLASSLTSSVPGHQSKKAKSKGFIEIKPGPYAKMQRKVLALWSGLGYDVEKLHRRCKKQFGTERFEWVQDYDQLHVLITDLEARLHG